MLIDKVVEDVGRCLPTLERRKKDLDEDTKTPFYDASK